MQSNYLPPLEPIGDFRSYVCGDVVIDQTAAIALGVLIQADQGGRITIAAGVCIGMGAVLHAQDGLLEIGAGASLGAGVLVYGTTKIGEGACIGASSSIVRAIIAKGAIVPPCSLISGLEQSAIAQELEISPAIAQELEISNTNTSPTNPPTNHSFTHTYSPVERIGTEKLVEMPTDAIADQTLGNADPSGNEQIDTVVNPMGTDISTLAIANSAQAKAHAQSQINRFIKRLYPQN
jgi:carbon dioxide concentrating mechanism protein CcmN